MGNHDPVVIFGFALADLDPDTEGPILTSEGETITIRNTADRTIRNEAMVEIEDNRVVGYTDLDARNSFKPFAKASIKMDQEKHYPEHTKEINGRLVINGLPDSEVALGSVSLVAGTHTVKITLDRCLHRITRVYTHLHCSGHQVCGQDSQSIEIEITGNREFTLTARITSNVARVHWIAVTR